VDAPQRVYIYSRVGMDVNAERPVAGKGAPPTEEH
jgi:hypothetical protein